MEKIAVEETEEETAGGRRRAADSEMQIAGWLTVICCDRVI